MVQLKSYNDVAGLAALAEERFEETWTGQRPAGVQSSPVQAVETHLDSQFPSVDLVSGSEGGVLTVQHTDPGAEPRLALRTEDGFVENPTMGEIAEDWKLGEGDVKEAVRRADDALRWAQPMAAQIDRIRFKRARNEQRMKAGTQCGIQGESPVEQSTRPGLRARR